MCWPLRVIPGILGFSLVLDVVARAQEQDLVPIFACDVEQVGFHMLQRSKCGVLVWKNSFRKSQPLRVAVENCPIDYNSLPSLVEHALNLKPREPFQQPWRYFEPQGQCISSPDTWVQWLDKGPIFLIEGGQFQWPPVRVGFVHKVEGVDGLAGTRSLQLETLALEPPIFRVTGALTLDEADSLVGYMLPRLSGSKVVQMNKPQNDQPRLSRDYRPAHNETPLVAKLEALSASLVRTPLSHFENPQLVSYKKGGYYWAHDDAGQIQYYYKNQQVMKKRHYGHFSRMLTILWYLNDVPHGGGTNFPMAETGRRPRTMTKCEQGLTVAPEKGHAVLWYNLDPSGWVNPCALHAACIVEEGEKHAVNIWVHNKPSHTPPADWDPHHPRIRAFLEKEDL